MKVYDLCDKEGRVFAFEIDTLWFGREGCVRFLASLPEVRVIPRNETQDSTRNHDTFCSFMFRERRFVAWEPWGDSSRFWIGPDPPEYCDEVAAIRAAFAARKLWPWQRWRRGTR